MPTKITTELGQLQAMDDAIADELRILKEQLNEIQTNNHQRTVEAASKQLEIDANVSHLVQLSDKYVQQKNILNEKEQQLSMKFDLLQNASSNLSKRTEYLNLLRTQYEKANSQHMKEMDAVVAAKQVSLERLEALKAVNASKYAEFIKLKIEATSELHSTQDEHTKLMEKSAKYREAIGSNEAKLAVLNNAKTELMSKVKTV